MISTTGGLLGARSTVDSAVNVHVQLVLIRNRSCHLYAMTWLQQGGGMFRVNGMLDRIRAKRIDHFIFEWRDNSSPIDMPYKLDEEVNVVWLKQLHC